MSLPFLGKTGTKQESFKGVSNWKYLYQHQSEAWRCPTVPIYRENTNRLQMGQDNTFKDIPVASTLLICEFSEKKISKHTINKIFYMRFSQCIWPSSLRSNVSIHLLLVTKVLHIVWSLLVIPTPVSFLQHSQFRCISLPGHV